MNDASIYLLRVLKGFIHGEDPGVFEGDWNEIVNLAGIQSVLGILGYSVMNYPKEEHKAVYPFMRQQCLQNIGEYSQRAEYMKLLIEKMNQEGIDHLIFKGYIVRNYYPVPELRSFGDIDFLIHTVDRKKSDELMMQEGFKRGTDWEPVYSYGRGMEYYEIHTDVMEVDVSDQADYKGYFQKIWENANVTTGHTWELTPEFHLLYLLTHMAKHISGSGAGIRMYMDIAVFVKHFGNQLDWDYIKKELNTLAFNGFSNMVFTIVKEYFGVEVPLKLKKVDNVVLADFMDYTMAGGTFGHHNSDAGVISLKKQDRNKESVSRMKTFMNRLFPKAADMEKRYTYLQDKHWLTPIAWIHRFFRTRDTWGMHAKEAQSIMNADTEEVLKLKKIYKEIGL